MISSDSTTNLSQNLLSGTAITASDCSYYPHDQVVACAWILSTPDTKEWIKGGGFIPGDKNDQSAYMSELGVQLGISLFIFKLIIPNELQPNIFIAYSRFYAWKKVGIDWECITCSSKCVDLISIIRKQWGEYLFHSLKQHVYGHQDNSIGPLTLLEHLNYDMDEIVNSIALAHISSEAMIPSYSTWIDFITVTCQDHLITSIIQ